MLKARVWRYTLEGIAEAACRNSPVVGRDIRTGRFDPGSLASTAMYIASARSDIEARELAAEEEPCSNERDETAT